MSLSLAIALGAVAGLFALVHFRPEPTLRAVRECFYVPMGLLGDITDGLERFLSRAWAFWRTHFGEEFGMRPLLGGVLRLALALVINVAEFELLRLSMEVILQLTVTLHEIPLLGAQTMAGLAAYTGVGLTLLLAEGALEMFGEAEFFRWTLSPKARKVVGSICLAAFVCVCAVQALAGVVRVWEGRQQEQQAAITEEQLLRGPRAKEVEPGAAQAEAPAWARAWDGLPVWVVGIFGFLVPFGAGLWGAKAIHAAMMSVAGLAMAVPLGVVTLGRGVLRVIAGIVARIADLCESTLSIAAPRGAVPAATRSSIQTPPVSSPPAPLGGPAAIEDHHAGTGGASAEPSAGGGAAEGGDDHRQRAEGPASRNGPGPAAGAEQAGLGAAARSPRATEADLLGEAMAPNPLNVPDDLLTDRRETRGGEKR